jgi:3-methyl-2-oxobutanoate hydroxymethyltransferase
MSTRPRTPAPATPAPGKVPLPELAEMKRRHDRIVMVTAYDAPAGRLADQAGVELILVGDTAAMVMLGHESTLPVTLDEMIFLTRAVTRAARRPLVIGDLPFGSYESSDEQGVASAIRMVKEAGADVVKLEGAGRMVSRVRAIAESGIGVMGHVGLTPQSATKLGGFRAQGRTAGAALKLYDDALALEEAGAFAVVLEAVPAPIAARITAALEIPTIGIGAGGDCDGQVLVWHDLLGMYPGGTPRFVKRYAELAEEIADALGRYAADVRNGAFPEEQHTYSIPDEQLAAFEAALSKQKHQRRGGDRDDRGRD